MSMARVVLTLFIMLVAIEGTASLSCLPCNTTSCASTDNCAGGKVKDACDCCDVCARQVGESCGGPFDIEGKCDAGLECYKDPLKSGLYGGIENQNGVCRCPPNNCVDEPCGFITCADNSTCEPNYCNCTATCIPPPTCDCSVDEDVIHMCLRWTKYDIMHHFEGLCFGDKLKKAIEYVEQKLYYVTTRRAELTTCKHAFMFHILRSRYDLFERYNECCLNIYCALKKFGEKLRAKKTFLEQCLAREEENSERGFFGNMYHYLSGGNNGHDTWSGK